MEWSDEEPTVSFGEPPRPPGVSVDHPPHESPPTMTKPLLALAALAAVGGVLNIPLHGLEYLVEWLHPVFEGVPEIHAPSFTEGLALSMGSVLVGLIGIGLAAMLYRRSVGPVEHNPALERFGAAGRVFGHAYYFDEGISRLVGGPLRRAATWLSDVVDARVVDGGVTGIGDVVRRAAVGLRGVQSGLVRNYALWIVIGAAGLLLFLLLYAGR